MQCDENAHPTPMPYIHTPIETLHTIAPALHLKVTGNWCIVAILHSIDCPHIILSQSPLAIECIPCISIHAMPQPMAIAILGLVSIRIILLLLHLRLIGTITKLSTRVLGIHRRNKIDKEREDIKREDECNGPLKDCSDVVHVAEGGDCEDDGEYYFKYDES